MPFCDMCGAFMVANEVHPYNHRGREVCHRCSPREAVWRNPQFITTCESCGADGVRLHSCQITNVDVAVDSCGGFSLADSSDLETTFELVRCPSCQHIGPLRRVQKG